MDEFKDEPTYYCKSCLSLHIVVDNQGNDMCGSCGAVNFVSVVPYKDYEKMMNERDTDVRA